MKTTFSVRVGSLLRTREDCRPRQRKRSTSLPVPAGQPPYAALDPFDFGLYPTALVSSQVAFWPNAMRAPWSMWHARSLVQLLLSCWWQVKCPRHWSHLNSLFTWRILLMLVDFLLAFAILHISSMSYGTDTTFRCGN